ncbi:MAG: CCA tRNA nucleotidyltransferase, mitochondrial [Candelina submexicana]|nr:MAG: CCA tRNA nucleotidyltransferase, mitochondrial [Candelina submexicana]
MAQLHQMASPSGNQSSQPRRIELTPTETRLRQLLLDVASYIDSHSAAEGIGSAETNITDTSAKDPLVLRFTGGWVRDKLLGVESHDIDVGINKMTGYQFGLRMEEYLQIPGNTLRYGLNYGLDDTDTAGQSTLGGLHKIEANPEKSKHLETVTTRIMGLDIDLVNLRKETYSEESRNPQMEFGTPEEDALRRDATINAMFFNLHDCSIEDLTGHGFEDMELGIIRTPLEAYQTFEDDPLRILRLVRFASRLSYKIDPQAAEAMGDAHIKAALKAKISRERVGTEIEKMLKGPNPHRALQLINDLQLYSTIFTDPNDTEVTVPNTESWPQVYDCYQKLVVAESESDGDRSAGTLASIRKILITDTEGEYLGWLLTALAPWANVQATSSSESKLPPPVAAVVAREGIKATSKVCKIVTDAVRNANEIAKIKEAVVHQGLGDSKLKAGEDVLTTRDGLGMAVRRWGKHWRSHALLALLLDVEQSDGSIEAIQITLNNFYTFLLDLEGKDLLEAYALTPSINGKQLSASLSIKSGVWMKDALDVVMAWQLRNPDQKISENALNEVQTLKTAFIEHILKNVVRPLFDNSTNQSVTSQGRKATKPKRQKHNSMDSELSMKPWKFDHNYSLDLLSWALRNSDEALVEKSWPMIIPPVLTILDDDSPGVKARGCELLDDLLKITSSTLLERTGLGQVLTDAVMPCLLYLPTLTPEAESIRLLSAAYPALITLARARFTPATHQRALSEARRDPERRPNDRVKYFDEILREGVLGGYRHAGEHVKIAELLVRQIAVILDQMGIQAVKHTKVRFNPLKKG